MIRRIVTTAKNFGRFLHLPSPVQTDLLTKNADVIVSLWAAVFFQKKTQGVDQILSSLGVNDLECAHNILSDMARNVRLKHVDYLTLNTIQYKPDLSEAEMRYDQLLECVGDRMAFDENLVILLSYILLFSSDCPEVYISHGGSATNRKAIEDEALLMGMLYTYIRAKFNHEFAAKLYNAVMKCKEDLQELTLIRNNRQMSMQEGASYATTAD